MTKQDIEFVVQKLQEGQVSGRAPIVHEFEEAFASYLGVKYAVAVSSGTAALHLALLACRVPADRLVAQPSLTTMSTAFAASYIGAKILPLDIEGEYWCINPKQVYGSNKGKLGAIIVVHLYGNPARVDEISDFAVRAHVPLIEDCSHALGGRLNGRPLGTFGDVGTFSFFSNKLITTGEGGMLLTDDEEVASRCKSLRDMRFGKSNKFVHEGIGYSYRISAMQAALGLSQLRRVDDLISAKRRIGQSYHEQLDGTMLQLHPDRPNSYSYPWMYSVVIKKPHKARLRDLLMSDLARVGIETRPFFVPIHKQTCYSTLMKRRLPISEDVSMRGINLPSSAELTAREIGSIATAVNSSLAKLRNPDALRV